MPVLFCYLRRLAGSEPIDATLEIHASKAQEKVGNYVEDLAASGPSGYDVSA
jgi:hypothetical protein